MKQKYVLGFMFNEKETDVLLITKNKPTWQKGLMNGIGGKIEQHEPPYDAMVREFKEETGIMHDKWLPVIELFGDDWAVQVYTCKSDSIFNYKKMESEEPNLIPLNELDSYPLIKNLYWLIEMSRDKLSGNMEYYISNVSAEVL